jgi:hypothetical protein
MVMPTDIARMNEVVSGVKTAQQRRAARQPAPVTGPQFRTLGTGVVLDRKGNVVFTPAVAKKP